MRKFNKVLSLVACLAICFAFVMPVFGITFNENVLDGAGTANSTVSNLVNNVWGTISLVVQVLAIACVVFAGLRYMFASADAKADIKKQTIILVVGAVLVFGATYLIGAISTITKDTLN